MRVDGERIRLIEPTHGRDEAIAASRVARSGQLASGEQVAALESELAAKLGVDEVVAVANGTAALHLCLRALGIGPGDEVITTPFTFFATVAAILHVGATPVLVDVDPTTGNLDPGAANAAIGPRTAAILPVHLYGRPADLASFTALCARHGLALVEDAAQALGARYAGRPVGTFGVGCFSFYGSKNVSCGEGGAIATREPAIARRLRRLRNHGADRRYHHTELGWNLRMSDLHAAVLRVQLTKLEEITHRRRRLARTYDALLEGARVSPPPPDDDATRSCYHLYTIRCQRRRSLATGLDRMGIETGIHYPRPIYRQPAWPGPRDPLPNVERLARQVLSIPLHPRLTRQHVQRVADAIRELA